jgi:hypothetical protein
MVAPKRGGGRGGQGGRPSRFDMRHEVAAAWRHVCDACRVPQVINALIILLVN